MCLPLVSVLQAAAATGQLATPESVLAQLVSLAPLPSLQSFIAVRFAAHMCARDRCVPHTVRQQVLQELRATPLHQIIQPFLEQRLQQLAEHGSSLAGLPQQQQQQQFLSEKLTMLLLLQEPTAWGPPEAWADQQQYKQWQQLLDASAVSIVEGEVQYLRQQLLHIDDVLHENRDIAAEAGGVCSTCSFQLDCSVKGCVKGDAMVSRAAAAVAAAATGERGARLGPGRALHSAASADEQLTTDCGSSGGCCSHEPLVENEEHSAAGHACCS